MAKKTVLMIDPPSGWKYGFPKPLPDPKPENVLAWLVENGYPQSEIDSCGNHFYSRYWEDVIHITDTKCPGGNWREKCDNWECVGGCKHEKEN